MFPEMVATLRRALTTMPLRVRALDHVCVCVTDVDRSIAWYRGVLGLEHVFADEPSFGRDPAFLRSGAAAVALLPLGAKQRPVRDHLGAHFALGVDLAEWHRFRAALPALLSEHRAGAAHSTAVDAQDYGLQLSLFFSDPDANIVEVTTWVDAGETRRL